MLKLIKAELYKTFNRAYFYVYMGGIAVLIASLIVSIRLTNAPVTVYYMMVIAESTFILPVFIVLAIVGTVTNEEIKEKTLRNTVSFGIPRNKLYMAKIITSIILASISGIIILGVFFGSSFLMLEPGDALTANFVNNFFLRLLSALPLYTASIAICAILGFVIKSEMIFAFAYAGLFVILKPIISILSYFISEKLSVIDGLLISSQLTNLGATEVSSRQMLTTAGNGILYTVIFIVIGIVVFRRQEIR